MTESDTDPDEEVDHEEYIECKIYLLRGILGPWYTGLYSITGRYIDIKAVTKVLPFRFFFRFVLNFFIFSSFCYFHFRKFIKGLFRCFPVSQDFSSANNVKIQHFCVLADNLVLVVESTA